MFKKPDKKSLSRLGIVIAAAILVCVGSFYFLSRIPEIEEKQGQEGPKSMKEIIKSLSAPVGEAEPVSEEVQESISIPSGAGDGEPEVSEDILENLSVPK